MAKTGLYYKNNWIKNEIKGLIISENTILYKDKELNIEIKNLKKDIQFYLEDVFIFKNENKITFKITSQKDIIGFINPVGNAFIYLPVSNYEKLEVFEEPSLSSKKITTLSKNSYFHLYHQSYGSSDEIWDKIKLSDNSFGYIPPNSKLILLNFAQIKRNNDMYILSIILFVLLFIVFEMKIEGKSIEFLYEGNWIELLYLMACASMPIHISKLFKSKKEKYFYPNLSKFYKTQFKDI